MKTIFKMDIWTLWAIVLFIIDRTTAGIYLSPYATWNPTGITVAGCTNGTNGTDLSHLNAPVGISISSSNILYVADRSNHRIVVVHLDFTASNFVIGSGFSVGPNQLRNPCDTFVTNSSLYVTDTDNLRVQKLLLNGSDPTTVLKLDNSRLGTYFYLDYNANIYVTDYPSGTVLLFCSNSANGTIVAGNGSPGFNDDQLNTPYGVFVNRLGTIYVADSSNHRIMKWFPNATSGIRVAGNGTSGSSSTQLHTPTYVIVDTNEYMYISELGNNRITRWPPNLTFGVCIAACTGVAGTASTQLNAPHSLAFDSNGSLYVCEFKNHRVQKFQIINNYTPAYNRPHFSSCTTWDSNATTFANSSILGTTPYGIFVNINNTVYVPVYSYHHVQIWLEGSTVPIKNFSTGVGCPYSIFVTISGDIYVDNGEPDRRVDKWTLNANSSVTAMYVNNTCYSLFVDIHENLYCSMNLLHSVVKKLFYDNANTTVTIAGNGNAGVAANMLNEPRGIFVDFNLNLYVADCQNNRIQLFQFGNLNGSTIVGNGSSENVSLSCPTGLVFDGDGYLFIADSQNFRIIGSGPLGFRCIVGCTNLAGSTSDRLNGPSTLSFDSYGNLFVVDMMNNRIQKFLLSRKSCNETTTSEHTQTLASSIIPSRDETTALKSIQVSTLSADVTSRNHIQKSVVSTDTLLTSGTTIYPHNQQSALSFVPNTCSDLTTIGLHCNNTNNLCHMLQPCQNYGTCNESNTTSYGYVCSCVSGFNGSQCQYDYRPCKPNTCWNGGNCNETSNTTFVCSCASGWNGIYCDTKINYCQNVTCLNYGVCRPLFLNYSCDCLSYSYSGRHCEISPQRLTNHKMISRSVAYIAIIAMISVIMFVIIMDVLRYCFGINPIDKELKRLQQKKAKKKKPRCPVIIRFIYVNGPLPQTSADAISTIKQTTV